MHSPIIANIIAEKVPGKVKWNHTSLQMEIDLLLYNEGRQPLSTNLTKQTQDLGQTYN